MKRDHQKMTGQHHPNQHQHQHNNTLLTGATSSSTPPNPDSKSKMWIDDETTTTGDMDELLAVLGYKVKSSEMADVAQKLEQLEMAMGTCQPDGTTTISQLSDTNHLNPSDINSWLQGMLSELDPCSIPDPLPFFNNTQQQNAVVNNQHPIWRPEITNLHQDSSNSIAAAVFNDDSEYDLRAIPGIITTLHQPSSPQSSTTTTPTHKRIKTEPISPPPTTHTTHTPHTKQTTHTPYTTNNQIINPQETGIRLVHTLLACAESIQTQNHQLSNTLLKQIGLLAVSQSGAMRKVATYFAEALARKIYKIHPDPSAIDAYTSDVLQSHFYDTCPYLKFAHFTANQAILESIEGAKRIHVIDFSLKQGMQWPALIQALAVRDESIRPVFKLTSVVGLSRQVDGGIEIVNEVGWKLSHFAKTLGVEFYFQGVVCDDLSELESDRIIGCSSSSSSENDDEEEEEVVVVNSVFELHRVLARPNGIDNLLNTIRSMKPKIFTVVEQEAEHNGPVFLDRFNEALHYYSTMFDSLESVSVSASSGEEVEVGVTSRDVAMSEDYLGRQICNVVACEGIERVERHETLVQWRGRLEGGGFETVHLGSNAFKQARMLLALSGGGDGYKVEENGGCLTLGWHTRPLIATSAWRLSGGGL